MMRVLAERDIPLTLLQTKYRLQQIAVRRARHTGEENSSQASNVDVVKIDASTCHPPAEEPPKMTSRRSHRRLRPFAADASNDCPPPAAARPGGQTIVKSDVDVVRTVFQDRHDRVGGPDEENFRSAGNARAPGKQSAKSPIEPIANPRQDVDHDDDDDDDDESPTRLEGSASPARHRRRSNSIVTSIDLTGVEGGGTNIPTRSSCAHCGMQCADDDDLDQHVRFWHLAQPAGRSTPGCQRKLRLQAMYLQAVQQHALRARQPP